MGNMARELLEAEQPMEQNPEEPGGREPNGAQERVDRTTEQEPGADQDAERNLPQKGIYGEHERTSCPDYRCLPPSALGTASRERGEEVVSVEQRDERMSGPQVHALQQQSALCDRIRQGQRAFDTGVQAPFNPDLAVIAAGQEPTFAHLLSLAQRHYGGNNPREACYMPVSGRLISKGGESRHALIKDGPLHHDVLRGRVAQVFYAGSPARRSSTPGSAGREEQAIEGGWRGWRSRGGNRDGVAERQGGRRGPRWTRRWWRQREVRTQY